MANNPNFPENPHASISGAETPSPAMRSDRIARFAISGVNPDTGAKENVVLRLNKDRLVLGSVISADVRLAGEGVAPLHAVVELDGEEATIYDLASDSGVFVNGDKVVTAKLKSGDKLTIGYNELTFTSEPASAVSPKDLFREVEGRKLFLDPNEDTGALLLQDAGDERGVREIFDFRPTQRPALEVIMSWFGTVLEVEHFTTERSVTIGVSRKSDFGIPPILSSSKYSFVTRRGSDFVLHLDPQMKGVMHRSGKLENFDEIRAIASRGTGGQEIHSTHDGYAITIGKDDFAKVAIGDVVFYLSFTAAPPRLKRRAMMERDPLFLQIFLGSMALTGAVVGAMMTLPVPQSIDAEKVPERIATILYQPEKYPARPVPQPPQPKPTEVAKAPEPPKPTTPPVPKKTPEPQKTVKIEIKPNPVKTLKPVPKEMNVVKAPENAKPAPVAQPKAQQKASNFKQNEAKEGEGARAKGTEGSRGQKNAKANATHQDTAMRPSANAGKGLGGGESQVANEANVDVLKGATSKIQDILGNAGQRLGKDGERLKGFGGFTTQGNGGLALSGTGNGGGGTADTLTGGLGKKGIGGGKVGTGLGAAGNGSGIAGGSARVAIRTGGPEEAVVMGSIDADAVEAALLAHKDEFRLCYEREINAEHPDLAGRVGTTFVIGSSGRVTQAGIESTSLHNQNVEKCILKVIRSIDFPIPRGAGMVQVTYPFKYSPVK